MSPSRLRESGRHDTTRRAFVHKEILTIISLTTPSWAERFLAHNLTHRHLHAAVRCTGSTSCLLRSSTGNPAIDLPH